MYPTIARNEEKLWRVSGKLGEKEEAKKFGVDVHYYEHCLIFFVKSSSFIDHARCLVSYL